MDESSKERNLLQTPFWKHLTEKERDMIFQQSHIKLFKKGQLISSSDSSCMGIVFVIKGGIRVSLLSDEGREITLYRLSEDECCVTTASCVIQQITFDTVVSASEETKLLVIPALVCSQLSKSNP